VATHEATAVVLVDATGTIQHWSKGATALFGHAKPVGQTLESSSPADLRDR
jgi:hypothetical protein